MSGTAGKLPENIDDLKALVLTKEELVAANKQLLLEKDQMIAELQEQLQLLLHKRLGDSS
jgi:hypothetical protein